MFHADPFSIVIHLERLDSNLTLMESRKFEFWNFDCIRFAKENESGIEKMRSRDRQFLASFMMNLIIQLKFRNSNFLESLGRKFESNQSPHLKLPKLTSFLGNFSRTISFALETERYNDFFDFRFLNFRLF